MGFVHMADWLLALSDYNDQPIFLDIIIEALSIGMVQSN